MSCAEIKVRWAKEKSCVSERFDNRVVRHIINMMKSTQPRTDPQVCFHRV